MQTKATSKQKNVKQKIMHMCCQSLKNIVNWIQMQQQSLMLELQQWSSKLEACTIMWSSCNNLQGWNVVTKLSAWNTRIKQSFELGETNSITQSEWDDKTKYHKLCNKATINKKD
jgi:hypothetical protein